jgi:hypothetical protein
VPSAAGGRGLGPDEQAIVDLVVVRRLDFGAIASVTGIAEREVRARARHALTTLGGGDPGGDITAFLLGVATHDECRRARSELQTDRETAALARAIVAALEPGWAGYVAPPLPRVTAGRARSGPRERRLLGWLAASILAASAVVAGLALAGVFARQDSAGGGVSQRDPLPAPVRITFVTQGGASGGGSATIGVTPSYRPYMDLDLKGLPPAPKGAVYMLWIDNGRGRGYPLPAPIEETRGGDFRRRYNLAIALAPLLSLGREIDLVVVDRQRLAKLSREVTAAGEGGGAAARLPSRPGETLLRGPIPQK